MDHTAVLSPVSLRERRPPLLAEPWVVSITAALTVFSLVMVYSTTGIVALERFGDSLFFLKRQLFALLIGIGGAAVLMRTPLSLLRKLAPFALLFALLLLLGPLLPGVGDSAGGARRWVNLGPLRFQPGEVAKVLFVLFMAGYFARHEHSLGRFSFGIVKPLIFLSLFAVLFLSQPDFGSTAILFLVCLGMSLSAGVRLRYLALGGVLIAAALLLLVIVSPYRMSRVVSFLSPFADVSGKGYQLIQSLIAVGRGELAGVGLGASQQKLYYLPAAHTDFIFAVIAEELGFLGAMTIVACYFILLWRGLRIASIAAGDTFASTLALGLTLLVVVPALLNVGVVIGLLPTKGLVLPLVGYGGTNLIASLCTIGLLLAVARAPDVR